MDSLRREQILATVSSAAAKQAACGHRALHREPDRTCAISARVAEQARLPALTLAGGCSKWERTSAKMQTESVSSWLPVPTKAQKTLRYGGKRKTSPWMYFQPVSSWSSPAANQVAVVRLVSHCHFSASGYPAAGVSSLLSTMEYDRTAALLR